MLRSASPWHVLRKRDASPVLARIGAHVLWSAYEWALYCSAGMRFAAGFYNFVLVESALSLSALYKYLKPYPFRALLRYVSEASRVLPWSDGRLRSKSSRRSALNV